MLRITNNDARLVRRTLSGHQDAFSTLVERYERVIFASAYGIVANASDAEDVTQDAFLTAFNKLPSLREPAKFRSWILAIARNLSADLLTKRKRESPISESDAPIPGESESIADAELRVLLRERIDRLPIEQREILLLHYYVGLKVREVADQLDISTEAAKKRLQRARDLLTQRMLVHLGDSIEEQSPSSVRTKTIIGLIAGSSATWKSSAAAAATTGILSSGVAIKFGIGASIAAGVIGAAIWSNTAPDFQPQVSVADPDQTNAPSGPFAATTPDENEEALPTPEASSPATTDSQPVNRSGEIRGQVVNSSGAHQADILVTADAGQAQYSDHYETRTDENGHFSFSGMRSGARYLLQGFTDTAFAAGEAYAHKTGDIDDAELTLFPAAELSGTVVDSTGQPQSNLSVIPYKAPIEGKSEHVSESWRRLRGVQTDNEGRFTLHHAWLGDWTLEIDSPIHVYLQAEELSPTESPHVIELEDGARISGRVVHIGTDRGVPNLELGMGNKRETVTDRDGTFFITGIAPGNQNVYLTTKDFIVTTPRFAVFSGRETSGVRIEVARAGSISGTVTSAETSEPLGGAVVEYSGVSLNYTKMVQADEYGFYEIEGLQPGQYRATDVTHWEKGSLSMSDEEPIEIGYGSRITGVDFRLSLGVTISGIVDLPSTDKPEEIQVRGVYPTESGGTISLGSGVHSDGAFEISGFPSSANVTLQLTGPGWTSESVGPLSLSAGDISDIHLTAQRVPLVSVTGRVTFGNDLPLTDKTIFLNSIDESGHSFRSESKNDGTFEFESVAPGRYSATVFGETDLQPVEVNVHGNQDLTGVVIHIGGGEATISGSVFDEKGMPIEDAEVLAPGVPRVKTDESGRYTIQGIKNRSYDVSVQAKGYGSEHRNEVEPNSHGVDFRLMLLGHVEGRIVDARSGAPIVEFDVNSSHSVESEQIDRALRETPLQHQVSSEGTFRVLNIAPGERIIVASAAGYHPSYTKVTVRSDDIVRDIIIRLAPSAVAHAKIVEANGTAVPNAKIFPHKVPHTFNNNSFNRDAPTTDRNGLVPLSRLVPGENQIFVYHKKLGRASFLIDTTRDRDTVTLTLPTPGNLAVHVTHNGEPAENIRLNVSHKSENESSYFDSFSGQTDSEGTYTFENIPLGPATLNVQSESKNIQQPVYISAENAEPIYIETGSGTGTIMINVVLPDHYNKNEFSAVVLIDTADGRVEARPQSFDGLGGFQFQDLPSGTATVIVGAEIRSTESRISRTRTFEIGPDDSFKDSIDFSSGVSVTGTATNIDPSGEYYVLLFPDRVDLALMTEEWFSDNHWIFTHQQRLHPSGIFQLNYVEPGTHTLIIAEGGMSSFTYRHITIGSDDVNIDVTMD